MVFLGHVLLADCIFANPEKMEKVKNWPTNKNANQFLSLPVLASYFWHLKDHFSYKSQCLHDLIGLVSTKQMVWGKYENVRHKIKIKPDKSKLKMKAFEWKTYHQEVFDALKQALVTASVWGDPDFAEEFILETDASLKGLLSHYREDGMKSHVAYSSRSLHPSENSMWNYSSAQIE